MPDIEFQTSAGSAPGYLAVPADDHGPGIVVMQEWWGLDDHIRSVCDRFAAEGFYALAPISTVARRPPSRARPSRR